MRTETEKYLLDNLPLTEKGMIDWNQMTFTNLAKIVSTLVRQKCEEQRIICAEHADADYTISGEDASRLENYALVNIESYCINSSILGAPEPNI